MASARGFGLGNAATAWWAESRRRAAAEDLPGLKSRRPTRASDGGFWRWQRRNRIPAGSATCVPVPRRGMATSPAVTIITNDYSPAIADLICERLMEGASLRQICQDRNMPARSIAVTSSACGYRRRSYRSRGTRAAERQLQAGADICFRLNARTY
jgi:hypothetical protein